MPGSKDTCHNSSKLSHDALFLECGAKSRVDSDWLISSSKLQFCLELCRFVQALLKLKFAKWKAHFLPRNLRNDPCATFVRTDGVWLEVCNRKEECCPRSLVATTGHILTLKLTASLKLVIESLFLMLTTRLTSLNSAYISFPPNQVCSLVHVYHWAVPWWFCNLLPLYSIGARVSLTLREYSTWRRSTLKPCGHDLNRALIYPSCPNVPEKIIFERANVRFSLEVLTPWRMSP
jgi:hypothetical protein